MALNFTTEYKNIAALGKCISQAEALTSLTPEERAAVVNGVRAAAQKYLTRKVSESIGQPNLGVRQAMQEFIRQQIADAGPATINAPTETPAVTSVTILGSGGIERVTLQRDRNNQIVYAYRNHTLRYECIAAPLVGFNYTAQIGFFSTPLADVTSSAWQYGLGFNTVWPRLATAQVDGTENAPVNTNVLRNGGMETFSTANLPDNWENVNTSTPATHVASVATPYLGTLALKWIGDGSHRQKFRQQLGSNGANATVVRLKPRTGYTVMLKLRRYATGAVTGTFRVSLVDSGGTVLTNGTVSASTSVNCAALGTTYASSSMSFVTPAFLSSSAYYVQIEMTTELGNTHEIFIDEVMLFEMTEVPGYGFVGVTEKSNQCELAEFVSVSTTTASGVLYFLLERLFDMTRMGLSPPTDAGGTETIADSLSVTCP